MFMTRTGNFPVGFRRGWAPWQKDMAGLIAWAKQNHFSAIDLGRDADAVGKQVIDAGLSIPAVDLPIWNDLLSADETKRQAGVARNAEYIAACSAFGVRNFFMVMLPENPALPRKENFKYMIESLNAMTSTLEQHQARLVIEGWPGSGALCCTPETVREAIKACHGKSIGINFDPSHFLRMNIDPIRFVEEFAERIYHVHGKDTELLIENRYEYGTEQPPTFGTPRQFGSMTWRYTIPGHGVFRWGRAFEILRSRSYQGAVSIELEDADFNGTTEGEQMGLLSAAHFLTSC